MLPLKLNIKAVQYDISARCNEITLYTANNEKVLEVYDYGNYVDIELLKNIVNTINSNERYCPITESLEESLKQMKLMREGKLPKKSWRELKDENNKSRLTKEKKEMLKKSMGAASSEVIDFNKILEHFK